MATCAGIRPALEPLSRWRCAEPGTEPPSLGERSAGQELNLWRGSRARHHFVGFETQLAKAGL